MVHQSSSEPQNDRGQEDREQKLRELAYQLWEAEGRPDGQADRHWFEACEMLESGVVGMLPSVPVDDPHWQQTKDVREVVIAQPVIPMSGRPTHDTPVQPTAPKAEPRQRKSADRMI